MNCWNATAGLANKNNFFFYPKNMPRNRNSTQIKKNHCGIQQRKKNMPENNSQTENHNYKYEYFV